MEGEVDKLYRVVLENLPQPVAVLDRDLKVVFSNQSGTELNRQLTRQQTLMAGEPVEKAFPFLAEGLVSFYSSGESYAEMDCKIHVDEKLLYLRVGMCRLSLPQEAFEGVVVTLNDLTDRYELVEQLRFYSNHDALTGLYNRTFFQEELVRLEASRKYPISILMIDVDNLKQINDRYGHMAGDDLLRRIADLLRESFRAEDMIARIGGDEFVVILPETEGQQAQMRLLALRTRLMRENKAADKLSPPLDLSIGIATAGTGSQLREAVRHADNGMYQNKRTKPRHR
ncbi:MAG: diguanylate cyclase [Anaerolineaceae bacterium]